MQTSLERIAEKARNKKKYRFRNLFRMINEELLYYSWGNLNKKAATGVDGVTYDEYAENLDENISRLVNNLKKKKYRTKLVRRKNIPKGNGKTRPLGIPALEDKLVQYAASLILQSIYEEDFLDCSFGYRKNRGAHDAITDLRSVLENDWCNFVVEADIKGFFDNIDHEWLIKMLSQRIDDKSFLWLVKKWLKAGILEEDGKVLHPVTGTPQGGIISPILANIYMHYVLNIWFEKVVKKYCSGRAYICVYADDFICVFENLGDAHRFYKSLSKRFGKFKLELSEEKTNIINFIKWANTKFDFLGFEFRLSNLMKRHVMIKTSKKKLQISIRNATTWCRENRCKRLKQFFKMLNAKLRGYYNYYGIRGNYVSIRKFHYIIKGLVFKWLNRRSQRNSYNWDGFKMMQKWYRLESPRIVHV